MNSSYLDSDNVIQMAIPRLGYACINTVLQGCPVKKDRVLVNHSCIAKTFREKGIDHVIALARANLAAVLRVLEWNEAHDIRFYRLSSNMFPHLTNPDFVDAGKYAYSLDQFDDLFAKIGQYAKEHNHRLTFHPGQFNQVGTPTQRVFENTVRDLSAHADILDKLGCGPDSVIVVHGGGVYGNKEQTMQRWVQQFKMLPKNVQARLVIENCERQYNYADMLELSRLIDRPVVFDTHHHACYCKIHGPLPEPADFLPRIIETWTKHGIKPKFHISEQAPNKRIGAHSDYVNRIPDYLIDLLDDGTQIDLMIEAKAKEQAVLYLMNQYFS